MPEFFFGQFLLERGEVDAAALDAASELCAANNRRFGALAVERGLMRPDQADAVFRKQRSDFRPFGEVACAMGLLSRRQLADLLFSQAVRATRLGEALLHLGHLDIERFGELLAAYEEERERQRRNLEELLAEAGHPEAALALVEGLSRAFFRHAGEVVKAVAVRKSAPEADDDSDPAPDKDPGDDPLAVTLAFACVEGASERTAMFVRLSRRLADLVGGGEPAPGARWHAFLVMVECYSRLAVEEACGEKCDCSLDVAPPQGKNAVPAEVVELRFESPTGAWGALYLPRGEG